MHYITIQEIIDYSKCPMYYFFKYKNKDLKTEYINLIEKYDIDIHKALYYSFTRVQEGSPIRIEDLKAAWGRAWVKDKRKSELIFTDTLLNKDTYNERRRKGLTSLITFHKNFNKNPGFPVIINKKYNLKISNNLTLIGSHEVIREMKDEMDKNYIEVCTFKTDEHTNNKINKQFDLKLIGSALAIKEEIQNVDFKYMMYHVDKNNFYYMNDLDMKRNIFNTTITNIYKAIYNKLYYICPSEKCMYCTYRELCASIENINKIVDK